MNNKTKKKSTVITIDATIHDELRKYCDEHGFKMGFLAEKAVREMLVRAGATTQVAQANPAITE
jgi:hypothetical protein